MLGFMKNFEFIYLFKNSNETEISYNKFQQNDLSNLFLENAMNLILISYIFPWCLILFSYIFQKYFSDFLKKHH